MREPLALFGHQPAAIQETDDVLVSFELVVSRDELLPAGRRLPIDAPELIVPPTMRERCASLAASCE